jgi:hypothetical protein
MKCSRPGSEKDAGCRRWWAAGAGEAASVVEVNVEPRSQRGREVVREASSTELREPPRENVVTLHVAATTVIRRSHRRRYQSSALTWSDTRRGWFSGQPEKEQPRSTKACHCVLTGYRCQSRLRRGFPRSMGGRRRPPVDERPDRDDEGCEQTQPVEDRIPSSCGGDQDDHHRQRYDVRHLDRRPPLPGGMVVQHEWQSPCRTTHPPPPFPVLPLRTSTTKRRAPSSAPTASAASNSQCPARGLGERLMACVVGGRHGRLRKTRIRLRRIPRSLASVSCRSRRRAQSQALVAILGLIIVELLHLKWISLEHSNCPTCQVKSLACRREASIYNAESSLSFFRRLHHQTRPPTRTANARTANATQPQSVLLLSSS